MEKTKTATASIKSPSWKEFDWLHPMAGLPTTDCEAEWWKGHIFYKANSGVIWHNGGWKVGESAKQCETD
eukprot:s2628_g12.t2